MILHCITTVKIIIAQKLLLRIVLASCYCVLNAITLRRVNSQGLGPDYRKENTAMIETVLRYMGNALPMLAWVGFGPGYYLVIPYYDDIQTG
jgi:hypothetical protein